MQKDNNVIKTLSYIKFFFISIPLAICLYLVAHTYFETKRIMKKVFLALFLLLTLEGCYIQYPLAIYQRMQYPTHIRKYNYGTYEHFRPKYTHSRFVYKHYQFSY